MKYNAYMNFKENNIYGFRRSTVNPHRDSKNSLALTQSLFPSKNNPAKNNVSLNKGAVDFCQTLSSSFGLSQARPESKHASRRQSNRPETSKGSRPYMNPLCQSGNNPRHKGLRSMEFIKSAYPSKSVYQLPHETMDCFNTGPECNHIEEQSEREEGNSSFENVRIVITRSEKPRKEKSFYNDKFQTNLPDDFLSLFAD